MSVFVGIRCGWRTWKCGWDEGSVSWTPEVNPQTKQRWEGQRGHIPKGLSTGKHHYGPRLNMIC